MPVLVILCLLQATNALKGPRLVSGEPGGTVTIQCHYTPSSVNRHQRKYWCRLSPVTRLCHTVVSTSGYSHLRYRDRVALADFPQSGLFVVRLAPLCLDDMGSYRCGIGNRNSVLSFGMNLTVSAGPPRTVPRVTPAAATLVTGFFGTASPAANRWTPGTTHTTGRQGTGWDRVALTPGTSKRTASAEGRQTPGSAGAGAAGTASQAEMSIRAAVPVPDGPASTPRGVSNATGGVWVSGARSSVANQARASEEGREAPTMGADRPREEAERPGTALGADWTATGAIRPSASVSEKWVWETPREARLVSKPQALGSAEGTTPAAGVWTLGRASIEVTSAEGNTEGNLDAPAGDSGPQATPSQDPAAQPLRPLGKGSSMKSSSPEGRNVSRILTPVSTVLFPLLALVLLLRKLWRRRTSRETERAAGVTLIQMTHFLELGLQPDPLPRVERKMLQDDASPVHATVTVPQRDCPTEGP